MMGLPGTPARLCDRCDECRGHGVYPNYSPDGGLDSVDECENCGGTGLATPPSGAETGGR